MPERGSWNQVERLAGVVPEVAPPVTEEDDPAAGLPKPVKGDFSSMGKVGGKRSGAKRQRIARKRRVLRADLRAQLKFQDNAEDLASVVISAALGRGQFKELPPRERAQFAVKGLEYGIGRPRPITEPVLEGEQAGLHFQIGPTEAVGEPAEESAVPSVETEG